MLKKLIAYVLALCIAAAALVGVIALDPNKETDASVSMCEFDLDKDGL